MARMIDEVRAERVAAPRWVPETAGPPLLEVLDAIREKLETAKVVVSDDVAELWATDSEKGVWQLDSDFPYCIPPTEPLWVEYRLPNQLYSPIEGKWLQNPIRDAGSLLLSESVGDGWRIHLASFNRSRRGDARVTMDPVERVLRVKPDGSFVPHESRWSDGFVCVFVPLEEQYRESLRARGADSRKDQDSFIIWPPTLDPALLTLSFMNTEDSILCRHEFSPAEVRSCRRRCGRPPTPYDVLSLSKSNRTGLS